MFDFETANWLVAAGAIFALVAVACRSDQLEWRKHQGRFIIGNVLVACYALSVLLHIWGRSNVTWFGVFTVGCIDLMLLNGAGEWKSGPPARMLRTAPPVRVLDVEIPHRAVDWIAGFTLGVPLIFASMLYQQGHGDPIEVYAGKAEPSAIEPGDPLILKWDAHRFRDCPGEVRQFLLDGGGMHLMTLPPRSAGKAPAGTRTETVVRVELPDLIPGQYTYRANVRSDCNDDTYSAWSPDVPFTVVAFKGEK